MNNIPAIAGGTPVRDKKLYYGHQYIDDKDINAVVEVLKSDYLTCGPKIEDVEKKLCQITDAKHACLVSNGTAALHVALQAIGVGEGEEIITTPLTFAASANCGLYCGAKVVFADVNEETYNIDPASVKEKITDKTKAVVAVDFTGQAVELDELLSICHEKGIKLVEDGAHSIGTKYKGRKVGSIADVTTFSFHPVKTVTCGEGGAIMTNDDEIAKRLYLYRSHGITREADLMVREPDGPWYYEQIGLGMNYRMTDMQAALLGSQLDKLEIFSKRRSQIVKIYDEAFSKVDGLIVQKEIAESDTTRHLYILRLDLSKLKCTRREFFDAMNAENICCNVHYIPVYRHPYYEQLGYKKGLCPVAEKIYEGIMSLPLYYSLTDEDVNDVIEAVKKLVDYYHV